VPFLDIDLQGLLSRIYDTGSGDWEPLLDDIKQFLGGSATALILHDFRHNLGSISLRAVTTKSIYARAFQLMLVTMSGWRMSVITGPPGKSTLGSSSSPNTNL
jgi:hypothetical protein